MSQDGDDLRGVIGQLASDRDTASVTADKETWQRVIELGMRDVGIAESSGGSGGSIGDLVVIAAALAENRMITPITEESVARWACMTSGHPMPENATVGATRGPVGRQPGEADVCLPWADRSDHAIVCTDDNRAWLVRLDSLPRVQTDDMAGVRVGVVHWDSAARGCAVSLDVPAAKVLARRTVLRAASLVGASRGALELTRAYVQRREQFDAPLVRMPAVARNLALMRAQLVQANAALAGAVTTLEDAGADDVETLPDAVLVAEAIVGSASGEVARLAHQLHGAIGITDEYPLAQLTRAIWAWRAVDAPAYAAEKELGARARTAGESAVWERMTAWEPAASS